MNVTKAARAAKVSSDAVRRWIATGVIEATRPGSGHLADVALGDVELVRDLRQFNVSWACIREATRLDPDGPVLCIAGYRPRYIELDQVAGVLERFGAAVFIPVALNDPLTYRHAIGHGGT